MFLSHCLLNENVRFPGGATCPGVTVTDREHDLIAELHDAGAMVP